MKYILTRRCTWFDNSPHTHRALGCMYSGIKQKQPKNSPSPAGRSPQRGRDGVGVSNNIDESKACFSRLLPSPQPSPTGRGSVSALCLVSVHYTGLDRVISNLFDYKWMSQAGGAAQPPLRAACFSCFVQALNAGRQ